MIQCVAKHLQIANKSINGNINTSEFFSWNGTFYDRREMFNSNATRCTYNCEGFSLLSYRTVTNIGTDLPFRKVSTYDIVALDKYDHDVYNTFVYLLSLRVAEELGDIMNDTHFVTDVRQSFSHAQKRVDLELWDNNKQFYRAWWDMEYGSPEWIMSDSLYGQVWAYSLGLGDLVPRNKLKSHLLSEIERNDSPFGLKVLNTGEAEMTLEDTSIILSKHIPGCKSLENITKHNSIWMGADADWTSLMLNLGKYR